MRSKYELKTDLGVHCSQIAGLYHFDGRLVTTLTVTLLEGTLVPLMMVAPKVQV